MQVEWRKVRLRGSKWLRHQMFTGSTGGCYCTTSHYCDPGSHISFSSTPLSCARHWCTLRWWLTIKNLANIITIFHTCFYFFFQTCARSTGVTWTRKTVFLQFHSVECVNNRSFTVCNISDVDTWKSLSLCSLTIKSSPLAFPTKLSCEREPGFFQEYFIGSYPLVWQPIVTSSPFKAQIVELEYFVETVYVVREYN